MAVQNQIRIIGGRCRGRKIPVLRAQSLRPTMDRARETLFNWLMHDIADARCLDVFAGSGALGFESLSRGAKCAVLLEKSSSVFHQLQQSCDLLGFDTSCRVKHRDATKWLARPSREPFDIIFIDPPFQYPQMITKTLYFIAEFQWILPDGLVYIEAPKDYPLALQLPNYWQIYKQTEVSEVAMYLLKIAH